MRIVVIHKSNPVTPDHFQQWIDKALLVCTVVPLTQITCAIRVLWGRFCLNIVHTTLAFKPSRCFANLNSFTWKRCAFIYAYLSWVSLFVFSLRVNRSLSSFMLKCLSTSSSLSTTQLLSAFLCTWRWKIFSSIVPVDSIRYIFYF